MIENDNIEKYTIALYREKYCSPQPIGTGILIFYNWSFYLISAFHVFDMEDERQQVENDPDEPDIQQDDMDGIYAKGIFEGNSDYLLVNENSFGLVFTFNPDEVSRNVNFNEDTEFIVCKLSDNLAQCFIDAGKMFYIVDESLFKEQNLSGSVILSGYPGYAQRDGTEVYRSYKGTLRNNAHDNGMISIKFDNNTAYCYEMHAEISIPRVKGIEGLSGGGIWKEHNDTFLPIGIIIKQDPNEGIVEGYNFDSIIKTIKEWDKANK